MLWDTMPGSFGMAPSYNKHIIKPSPQPFHHQVTVIGAHWDTVPGSPGVGDNGSGLAALLEVTSDHYYHFQRLDSRLF